MTDTFDRTQLDGKDRGQLSEIAAALGVKAVSRMRKADLVEAIVSATAGSSAKSGSGGDELERVDRHAAAEDPLHGVGRRRSGIPGRRAERVGIGRRSRRRHGDHPAPPRRVAGE